jgi:transcriptional regulator with XRE-family HTH domain
VTLEQLCAVRSLTLDQLAEAAGIAPATVVKIDAGTVRANPSLLRRLAAGLGLEPAALRDELSAARRSWGRSAHLGRGRTPWR